MQVAVWYHAWVGGAWQSPVAEFRSALDEDGFDGWLFASLIGPQPQRVDAFHALETSVPAILADEGNEYLTLNALREDAICNPGGAILYAHTKGASDNTEFRARWRRSMTAHVVANWRENLATLETGDVDAVGCHWLTEAEYPGMFGPQTIPTEGSGFFGGNFWMARCDYLRTLPPCEAEPRWRAESWIGINRPRVVDLLPGWPHDNRWPELCG